MPNSRYIKSLCSTLLLVFVTACENKNDPEVQYRMDDPEVQYRMGEEYESGQMGVQDLTQAKFWFEKSANQGYADAQVKMGEYHFIQGDTQDYAQAFQWFEKAANQGNAAAQVKMGDRYYNGYDLERDFALAFSWYQKAVEIHPEAQYRIGYFHKYRLSLPSKPSPVPEVDYQKSLVLFGQAAKAGHPAAHYELGLMYYKAQGVDKDLDKAYELFKFANEHKVYEADRWFEIAQESLDEIEVFKTALKIASDGSADSETLFKLGRMYERGEGTDFDQDAARRWYIEASKGGSGAAQYTLMESYWRGFSYKKGNLDSLSKGLAQAKLAAKSEQLEEHMLFNAANYVQWFEERLEDINKFTIVSNQAQTQSDAEAQFLLAEMYGHGKGVGRNSKLAYEWYQKAGVQGHKIAQHQLGVIHYYGSDRYFRDAGIEKNLNESFQWHLKSAKQGFAEAEYQVSLMYFGGEGTSVNKQKALFWEKKAADNSHIQAMFDHGQRLFDGDSVKQDVRQGLKLLEKSADAENLSAQLKLIDIYRDGDGVKADAEKADYWSRRGDENPNIKY